MTKTAFLFPGQGAQSIGMGKELDESSPAARQIFDSANDILGYDLKQICFNGPAEKINATNHSQPGLYVCSLAALAQLKIDQPQLVDSIDYTAGLSLGEYTALAFAGALSFEDGLKLVQARGDAMQAAAEQSASSMVSILGLEIDQVEAICEQARQGDEVLQVANILCPGNIVVSGHQTACDRIEPIAKEAGAMRSIELSVAGAFHTSLMEPALPALSTALDACQFHAPSPVVVSNVDAGAHGESNVWRDLLLKQVHSPVLWHASMEFLLSQGVEQFYEIGPGKVLKGLLKRINRKVSCENIG